MELLTFVSLPHKLEVAKMHSKAFKHYRRRVENFSTSDETSWRLMPCVGFKGIPIGSELEYLSKM